MRVRSLLSVVIVALGLLVAPFAAQAGAVAHSASASCYRQVGDHWECVTPGAFCPAAAHGKYGYSEDGDAYRCVQDGSYWRWKPTSTSGPAPTPTPSPTAKPVKPACSRAYLPLPDPKCQPGARNPAVTQATIATTVCRAGWVKKIQAPASYTNALRVKQIAQYGHKDTRPSHYQEDALIPLSLGGAPKSVKNLWPEPLYKAGGRTALDKDAVERRLARAVCAGDVRLSAAQKAIAKDWRTALKRLGL
ncbi:hypothetical protein GCM10009530_06660 [Microbispora corallina]|uniref:Secreted protein n=1 Tax=Microbispora corallina TaxID=83302 RepID=A0ABQ4FUY4_9ACTN|nr:hypothetical protein [Microbispora corallina]GIH38629.1 hypothetical protein Mco01_16290 [Microbispora corallina]